MQIGDGVELGFILKRFFPQQKKFSVLTQSKGKIILSLKKDKICQSLWPGMLIAFEPIEYGNSYFTNSIEIISEADCHQQDDMYWVHHLLELFYYFVPLDDPSDQLFEQLSWYLTILSDQSIQKSYKSALKKLFIVHFLGSMGSYAVPQELRHRLALLSSPNILLHDIEADIVSFFLYNSNKINQWIISCLSKHPCFKLFKTVSFMYSIQTMVEL